MSSSQSGWPWKFPPCETADIVAIQALSNGAADKAQQLRALEYIRDKLCQTDRMSFYPGADDGRRATDFAEGKRWVGLALRRIARLVPSAVDIHGPPPAMPGEPED